MRRRISLFLSVLMAVTLFMPANFAFAEETDLFSSIASGGKTVVIDSTASGFNVYMNGDYLGHAYCAEPSDLPPGGQTFKILPSAIGVEVVQRADGGGTSRVSARRTIDERDLIRCGAGRDYINRKYEAGEIAQVDVQNMIRKWIYYVLFSLDAPKDVKEWVDKHESEYSLLSSYAFTPEEGDEYQTLVAFFVERDAPEYTIKTSVVNGTITPSMTVSSGEDAKITYTPADGFKLSSVTVDGKVVDVSANASSYSFLEVEDNHNIHVVYEPITYTIKTSVINGAIDPDMSVPHNENATVNYSPQDGYHLESITVDGEEVDTTGYKDSFLFERVTRNHEISVVYAADKYLIKTSVINGTITDDTEVSHGDDAVVSYKGDEGHYITEITVDGEPVDVKEFTEEYVFNNVNANHEIAVTYSPEKYTITTSVENGEITPTFEVEYLGDGKIEYSPLDGYELSSIEIDGEKVDVNGIEAAYTFEKITENHKVHVIYKELPPKAEPEKPVDTKPQEPKPVKEPENLEPKKEEPSVEITVQDEPKKEEPKPVQKVEKKEAKSVPKTGDSENFLALTFVGLSGLLGVCIIKRRDIRER